MQIRRKHILSPSWPRNTKKRISFVIHFAWFPGMKILIRWLTWSVICEHRQVKHTAHILLYHAFYRKERSFNSCVCVSPQRKNAKKLSFSSSPLIASPLSVHSLEIFALTKDAMQRENMGTDRTFFGIKPFCNIYRPYIYIIFEMLKFRVGGFLFPPLFCQTDMQNYPFFCFCIFQKLTVFNFLCQKEINWRSFKAENLFRASCKYPKNR